MKEKISFAPPNCIFFLDDPRSGEIPEIDSRPVHIWSTRSCIIVGCLAFMDGETEFILSDSTDDAPKADPAFDGVLDTLSKVVEVSTSERETLLRRDVPGHFTRVRIWTDHPTEPEHILVVLG
ncbi:hypothetical protein ACSVBT_12745 [Afipia sp. TerB]